MKKQNLLNFKSIMGTLLDISTWYNPSHPKCRNCTKWFIFRDTGQSFGYCLYKNFGTEHGKPVCVGFELILGEFLG